MQPQQQQTVVVPAQPTYVAQPYHTVSVVDKYRSGQSTVIGILLIIAGALSIIFNIVDLVVGTDQYPYVIRFKVHYQSLSNFSNGVSAHGIWCGILVSIGQVFHYIRQEFVRFLAVNCNCISKIGLTVVIICRLSSVTRVYCE